MKNYSKSNEELHAYYTASGLFRFKHDFSNKELMGVGDLGSTSKNALLFLNEGGLGKVLVSNTDTYVSNEFKSISAKITSTVSLNTSEFIVATDGGIGIYDYSNNTFGVFNTSILNAQLYINKEDNRVVAISGNTLYFLDDTGAIAGSYTHTSNISGIALMYDE